MLSLAMIRDNFAPSSDTSSEILPNSEMADSTTSRPIYGLGGCLHYKTPYRYFQRLLLSNFEPSCSTSGKKAKTATLPVPQIPFTSSFNHSMSVCSSFHGCLKGPCHVTCLGLIYRQLGKGMCAQQDVRRSRLVRPAGALRRE